MVGLSVPSEALTTNIEPLPFFRLWSLGSRLAVARFELTGERPDPSLALEFAGAQATRPQITFMLDAGAWFVKRTCSCFLANAKNI
mmetsp:Transcript_11434/g.46100  ORF Transcript_11434/g.46100 Transcript_11434/m.46100 type:complete len:86 (+) Transcript_11434:1443-1700(+)